MSRNLFLLRPGALGDTLLLAPALAAIRATCPGLHLTLAAHPGAVALLAESGLVDRPLSRDDPRLVSLFGTAGDLAAARALLGQPEAAVAWMADPEGVVTANLLRLCAGTVAVAPSQPPPEGGRHVADHLADTLRPLGILAGPLPPPPLLDAPASESEWVEAFVSASASPRKPLVAVHPGSGGRRKNWSAEGFAAVVETLAEEATVVLASGPADEEALAAVLARARARVLVARDLPLPRVAALIARCGAFLGNDSALSHLAALLGVPTVALFGPTDAALWRPWGPRVSLLSWGATPESVSPEKVAMVTREAMSRQYG